jgi:hypothetical protein
MNRSWEYYQVTDTFGGSAYNPTHDTLQEAICHYHALIHETKNSAYPATSKNICILHVIHSETEIDID